MLADRPKLLEMKPVLIGNLLERNTHNLARLEHPGKWVPVQHSEVVR
jgi:hypothetical protein